jgi:hypothetical protein
VDYNPLVLHESANMFQSTIFSTLRSTVVARKEGFGYFQAQLSSLPLHNGSLGIGDPHDLLKYSFLSSQLSSLELQFSLDWED